MNALHLRLLALSAVLLGVACQSSTWSYPMKRNGPPFAEAFPDPSILLEARDVTELRKRLQRCPIPADEAHHERLLALVEQASSVRAENLALLTEAVALPSRSGGEFESTGNTYTVTIGGDAVTTFSREEGPYSHYVDDILLLGATKLADPSAAHLGRLMASTQKRKAVVGLYDLLGEECDDGSAKAMREMLRLNRFDEVRNDLLLGVLVSRGKVDQDRAEIALEQLSFDEGRLTFVEGWMPTCAQLESERLPRIIAAFSFDDGRQSAVRIAANSSLGAIDGSCAKECLKEFAFDEGRGNAMRALSPHLRIEDPRLLPELIEACSFDEGRAELLRHAKAGLSHGEALPASVAKDCLEEFSFDAGRENALQILAPEIQFGSFDEVVSLLKVASFDEGRVNLLRSVSARLGGLTGNARDLEDFLESFSFDSGRTKALRLVAGGFRGLPAAELWDVLDEAYSFDSGRKEAAVALALR